MDEEELEPRPRPSQQSFAPRLLDDMSVEELEAYIRTMETEIERVRADIAAKKGHMSDAEAVFRK